MKPLRNLLLLTALIGMSFQSFGQSSRSPVSTTAIGHMCVTLLTPAAVSNVQDLSFNNVSLRSATNTNLEAASVSATNGDMQMGSIRVQGSKAMFAVTVTDRPIGFNQNGRAISVGHFSATSNMDDNGASTIYIGATMRVKKAVVESNENASPLAVTINYN